MSGSTIKLTAILLMTIDHVTVYLFRDMKMMVGCDILPDTLFTLPAVVQVMLYNGKRGFIKGAFLKFCFYIYSFCSFYMTLFI